MEQIALHEGTSFLKQRAAWGCSAGCRSCFRTCVLGCKALRGALDPSGPGRRGPSGVDGG